MTLRPELLLHLRPSGAPDRFVRACATDLELFVDPCVGPTLDVGCGPGRLTGALSECGVAALGVDISPQAVRQARGRGASARCQDVFDPLPGRGAWRSVADRHVVTLQHLERDPVPGGA